LGFVGGLAMGSLLSVLWVRVNFAYQLGWDLDLHLSLRSVPLAALAAALVSVPARPLPARRIARLPVLAALRDARRRSDRARLSAGSTAGYGSRPDDAPPSDGALPRAGRRLRQGEDPERRPEPDGTVDQRSHRVLLSDAELRLRPDARRSAAVVESPPA